jgi:Methyltransferase FkbM domain
MWIKKFSAEENELIRLINTGEARLHFSQLGEDAVLWHLFSRKREGFYVDVGCFHPYRYSNTALLAIFNAWSGINIDVDDRAIVAFKAVRPSDVNLLIGIGKDDSQATLTLFEDGAVNSLDPTMTGRQVQNFKVKGTQTVRTRSLRSVLDEYVPEGKAIDFLNVDAEGWDQVVLESNNWEKYHPEVIAVESHGFDPHNPAANETFQFLVKKGYKLISHVLVTSIYRRS